MPVIIPDIMVISAITIIKFVKIYKVLLDVPVSYHLNTDSTVSLCAISLELYGTAIVQVSESHFIQFTQIIGTIRWFSSSLDS